MTVAGTTARESHPVRASALRDVVERDAARASRRASANWTACSAADSSPARRRCSSANPGSGKSTLALMSLRELARDARRALDRGRGVRRPGRPARASSRRGAGAASTSRRPRASRRRASCFAERRPIALRGRLDLGDERRRALGSVVGLGAPGPRTPPSGCARSRRRPASRCLLDRSRHQRRRARRAARA